MSLIKLIASRTGVLETEAAVTQAVEGMFAFRTALSKLLKLTASANDTVLLEAAGGAVDGAADARTKLGALLAALGIEDSGAAVEKVAGLMKQATELEAAMPELKSLREAAAATDAKEGEEEVDKVMNSIGSKDGGVRIALSMMRKADKAGFHKQYTTVLSAAAAPAASQQAGHAYLTTAITGGAGAAERQVTGNADGSVTLSAAGAGSKTGAPAGGRTQINLSKNQGRNLVERSMDYVRCTVAGADKWDFEQLFAAAAKLRRDNEIIDSNAAA